MVLALSHAASGKATSCLVVVVFVFSGLSYSCSVVLVLSRSAMITGGLSDVDIWWNPLSQHQIDPFGFQNPESIFELKLMPKEEN